MNLNQRIEILVKLGAYLSSGNEAWAAAREKAGRENAWFVPEFVDLAASQIARFYLDREVLQGFAARYPQISDAPTGRTLGIVMAGNIPLVGFHDFLCGFLAGYRLLIKPSSKDEVLIRHLVNQMVAWEPSLESEISFAEQLKGCDAYIATGSNNSGRYFEYYFRNYPSIIRKNRTSVAILTGQETPAELESLADDMLLYFGLGCRNVSKLYVPHGYNFQPLLQALNKYSWMADHNKFRNNYDYNLALHILNNKFYMTNGAVLLVENEALFSPISQVHYEFYDPESMPAEKLALHQQDLQCTLGPGGIPCGQAQAPGITDFADGVDTMAFLTSF